MLWLDLIGLNHFGMNFFKGFNLHSYVVSKITSCVKELNLDVKMWTFLTWSDFNDMNPACCHSSEFSEHHKSFIKVSYGISL